jgi:3',5'-cyclic AMP phosphodiesterase CpdA
MKTIFHFSDIHFGARHAPDRAEAILAEIEQLDPTVVAISGDLTQRARTDQFRQAHEFLNRIRQPLVVVPGNHDVPLWNLFNRFVSPLGKYRRWIGADLNPIYADDRLAVMGLDTTRSFTIKGGEINRHLLREVQARLCQFADSSCKVIVAHHPLAPPPGFEHEAAVGGSRRALRLFEECGVEIVLTGHLHQTHIASSKDHYPEATRPILLVQAGTAATLRGRGSERMKNSFNLIKVRQRDIDVSSYIYSDIEQRFVASFSKSWPRNLP